MADLMVRPLAEADIIAAHAWYSRQRELLGVFDDAGLGGDGRQLRRSAEEP